MWSRRSLRFAGVALALSACAPGEVSSSPPELIIDAGADADARLDRASVDDRGSPRVDASAALDRIDAVEVATARDVSPDDTPPSVDVPPRCVPTRSACNMALECGAIPNGCPGETFACGTCGGGETWCAVGPSRWQPRVYQCVLRTQSEHGAWFDPEQFRDTSSWLVLAPHAESYVAEVARCVDGGEARAVVDGNARGHEVRVRGVSERVAENFIVRTYGTGRTAGRYTSACDPAGF